jgi:hypothetical protein
VRDPFPEPGRQRVWTPSASSASATPEAGDDAVGLLAGARGAAPTWRRSGPRWSRRARAPRRGPALGRAAAVVVDAVRAPSGRAPGTIVRAEAGPGPARRGRLVAVLARVRRGRGGGARGRARRRPAGRVPRRRGGRRDRRSRLPPRPSPRRWPSSWLGSWPRHACSRRPRALLRPR